MRKDEFDFDAPAELPQELRPVRPGGRRGAAGVEPPKAATQLGEAAAPVPMQIVVAPLWHSMFLPVVSIASGVLLSVFGQVYAGWSGQLFQLGPLPLSYLVAPLVVGGAVGILWTLIRYE